MRHVPAVALVVAFVAALAAGCDDANRPRPTIVSGRTIVQQPTGGQAGPDDAHMALYVSSLPLATFIHEQNFGKGTSATVVGESDEAGRFTLSADIDEESAAHLILYARCIGIGCSTRDGCVYKALPALRRAADQWVVRSSGRPLKVTLRIGPHSCE